MLAPLSPPVHVLLELAKSIVSINGIYDVDRSRLWIHADGKMFFFQELTGPSTFQIRPSGSAGALAISLNFEAGYQTRPPSATIIAS
jgi:hypothetical protein